ncbi:flagellar hook-length control protein FliK [Marisediminicola antarctica]|uniref:Flagellar hook-length control protein-like C-terminal domain-containing protein n=1 Tax=Marisediminicola antarctica TaxID=674079 RepID=A0A7L5AFZ0_9MICO|nr:flagellar hook-length control protein FliK [Marisediminicola antarctica]QHO68625.1 hypothetical protein BHD05_02245 [Marisediminicola antarctica]
MTIIQREALPLAAGARTTPRQTDAGGFAAAMAEATAAGPSGERARATERLRSGGQSRQECSPAAAASGAAVEPAPVLLPGPTNAPVTGPTLVPTTGLAFAPVIAPVIAPDADLATERATESVLESVRRTVPETARTAESTAGPALTATLGSDTDTAAPAAPAPAPAPAAATAGELAASDTVLATAPVPMTTGATASATPAPTVSAPVRAAGATSLPVAAVEAQAGESAPAPVGTSQTTPSQATPPAASATVAAAPAVPLVNPAASPAASPAVSPGAQPTPAPLAAQVAAPLFTLAAAGRGEHLLTISVTPDSLGPVTVRAHVTGEGVRVELFAPSDLGRDALRAILPELRRDLAGAGLGGTLDLSQQNEPAADRERHRPREPNTGDAPPEPSVAVASPPGWGAPSTIDVFA